VPIEKLADIMQQEAQFAGALKRGYPTDKATCSRTRPTKASAGTGIVLFAADAIYKRLVDLQCIDWKPLQRRQARITDATYKSTVAPSSRRMWRKAESPRNAAIAGKI
jgi:hypothetical protein